jgi:hypothetical protein
MERLDGLSNDTRPLMTSCGIETQRVGVVAADLFLGHH